jgi:hypothetical protein
MPRRRLSARLARRAGGAGGLAPVWPPRDGAGTRGGADAAELDQEVIAPPPGLTDSVNPGKAKLAASVGSAGSCRYACTMRSQADEV